jgi:SAM-dependent methyltransferase
MAAQARQHRDALPADVQRHATLLEGDMRQLPPDADGPFALISLPYRTFMHLLTVDDQRAALQQFRQRLAPGGRLVLNVFDPTADMVSVLGGPEPPEAIDELPVDMEFDEPGSHRRVRVRYRRGYALEQQILQQLFFYEILDGDRVVGVEEGALLLRYTYRYEMEHLLRGAGFRVESLAGDFDGGPYAGYGEQIWVAVAA